MSSRPTGASGRLVGRAVTVIGQPALLIAYSDPEGFEPSIWRCFIDAPGGHTITVTSGHDYVSLVTDPVVITPAVGTLVIPDIIGSTVNVTVTGATGGQTTRAILVRVRS